MSSVLELHYNKQNRFIMEAPFQIYRNNNYVLHMFFVYYAITVYSVTCKVGLRRSEGDTLVKEGFNLLALLCIIGA